MPVAIGIALACLAASMNATGLNLQRYAQRHGLRVLNAVGLALAVLCGVADMASFGFAPQSLLAPFGSLTLVINLLLAPVLHGDQIRTVDLSSTALVFAGVAICLANGTAAAVPRTEAQLLGLLRNPPAWALGMGLAGAVCLAALRLRRAAPGAQHISVAACYSLIAGMLGSCTVLSAKLLSELLGAGAALATCAPVALGVGGFALGQLTVLNTGIGRHSSLVVVPIFVATFVTCNAVGGGVFYEEFALFTPAQARAYAAGVSLLVAGVLLLAMYPAPPAAKAAKKGDHPKLAFDNAGAYWSAASPGKRRAASPARVAARPKKG